MNRIVERFARLRGKGEKGLIVYLGAGDPNLEATRRLAPRWFDNFSPVKQAGTMKTATVTEVGRDFLRVLKWVETGEEVEVVQEGKPVAVFLPPRAA